METQKLINKIVDETIGAIHEPLESSRLKTVKNASAM